MIIAAEAAFYRDSAAASVEQEGAIVDLGCWLGATSIALADGLSDHSAAGEHSEKKVLGFDRFVWEQWMPSHVPYGLYEVGESFLPEARRVVRDHGGGKVELHQADLTSYQWTGGSIKILLVDAMKTEALVRQIARSFYPKLSSGSLLIHQDFKHFHTTWIHLLQYQLREYFRVCRVIPKGGTVAFRVLKPIPDELLERATDFANLSDDEVETSFRHSIDLVGSADAVNVAAAHVMHYIHLGRNDQARETLEIYREWGITEQGEFPIVLGQLASREARDAAWRDRDPTS